MLVEAQSIALLLLMSLPYLCYLHSTCKRNRLFSLWWLHLTTILVLLYLPYLSSNPRDGLFFSPKKMKNQGSLVHAIVVKRHPLWKWPSLTNISKESIQIQALLFARFFPSILLPLSIMLHKNIVLNFVLNWMKLYGASLKMKPRQLFCLFYLWP